MSREESSKRKEDSRWSLAGEEKGFDDVGSNICLATGRLFIGPVGNGPGNDVDVAFTQGAIFLNSSHHRDSTACSWQCPLVFSLYFSLLLQDGSLSYSEDQPPPPFEYVC